MRALRAAPLVVVAWTEASVESDWVLEEAEHGRKRGILLPLKLDDVDVPIPFGAIQTVDLTGFPREAVTRLITELEARAPEAVAPRAEAPGRARGPNNLPFHLANAAMALATVFLLIQIWRIANP